MAPQTSETRRSPSASKVHAETAATRETGTAESDENYDLVSVLYHCLKAADACTQYIVDAEDAGDDELVEFFEKARQMQNRLALDARELLGQRIGDANGASDEES